MDANFYALTRKWSEDLPAWQRDALRRLCGQSKLETADITALVAICKGADGGSPLDAIHVRDPAARHAVVSLGAFHGLSQVNALAPGERLTFGKSGDKEAIRGWKNNLCQSECSSDFWHGGGWSDTTLVHSHSMVPGGFEVTS